MFKSDKSTLKANIFLRDQSMKSNELANICGNVLDHLYQRLIKKLETHFRITKKFTVMELSELFEAI